MKFFLKFLLLGLLEQVKGTLAFFREYICKFQPKFFLPSCIIARYVKDKFLENGINTVSLIHNSFPVKP